MNKYKIFYPGCGRDFFSRNTNVNTNQDLIHSDSGVGLFSLILKHIKGETEWLEFIPGIRSESQATNLLDIVFCDNGSQDFVALSSLAIKKLMFDLNLISKYETKKYSKITGIISFLKDTGKLSLPFAKHVFCYRNFRFEFSMLECSWETAITYLTHTGWTLDENDSIILDYNFQGGEGGHRFGSYLHDYLYYDHNEFLTSDDIKIIHHTYRNDNETINFPIELNSLRCDSIGRPHIQNQGNRQIEE